MALCAAVGCNNRRKKDSDISLFRFPTELRIRKAWIHYCRRWDFVPGPSHRLCSAHFSSACYERDPQKMKELGSSYVRPRLLPNAIPDIPLNNTEGQTETSLQKRTAYEKRRKAEVLQMAFDNYDRDEQTEPSSAISDAAAVSLSEDVTLDNRPTQGVQTMPPPSPPTVKSKRVQTYLRPQQRTRKIQVNFGTSEIAKSVCTVGTQTDYKFSGPFPKLTHNFDCDIEEEDGASSHADSDSDGEYEPADDDLSSDDNNEEHEDYMNYRLSSNVTPVEEKQFLVSESSLAELLSVCRYCCTEAVPVINVTRGTLISTQSVCANGHISIWKSQTYHKTMPWSNLLTATAIMLSGCNASAVLRMFEHLNVQMFSIRTFNRLQSLYVNPAAVMTWDSEQATLLQELHGNDVVLGGDARCDSPGYSAKYGSYTLMDLQTKKIMDFQLVQCNEVKGSTHMELEGLKRGLAFLQRHVNVKEVVTDRHSSIKKYMRTEHADKRHLFDVWHVAKGVSKKLEAASKKSGGHEIRPWIKSIVNHIYWISSSCGMDGNLKVAKWMSILNHISNQHEGHSIVYPKCEHGQILQDRQWIKEGSVPFKRMKDIIESKFLLSDVPKLSPVYQTYALEVFHSIVNIFAPKSTHFFYSSMQARLSIAALHYNENCNRSQAVTKDGQQCYSMVYPKAKKGQEAVVKPRTTPASYDYAFLIKQAVVTRREHECMTYSNASDDIQVVNNHFPSDLTASYISFEKADLIERHKSRFQR